VLSAGDDDNDIDAARADVNGDNEVDINDITKLIAYLLNGTWD
jgi:hypothetical protein